MGIFKSDALSLGHHHFDELLVVDVAIAVARIISLTSHVGESLTAVSHEVAKLGRRDKTVAISTEDLEGLFQLP